jgi:hypothetical protein
MSFVDTTNADANFYLAHGCTREQHAERLRQRDRDIAREKFEREAVGDLEHWQPAGGSARAKYAAYHERLAAERAGLDAHEHKRNVLVGIKEAPKQTQSAIAALIKRGADYLMGRCQEAEDDVAERRALDDRLAQQQYRAESAEEALVEVDREIQIAKVRCKRLAARESDFLNPAVIEIAHAHIGSEYRKRAESFRAIVNLAAGVSEFSGYGLPPTGVPTDIKLPSFGALGAPKPIWASDAEHAPWRKLADALRADPQVDVAKLLPRLEP